ncbi:MAG: transposase [Phycisphaerae bacterium]|nr:transposase [Phycisphaerae bacterium]NIW91450.1 helix-turn-helix domain-containing protein [Phycisphaerae bacterium]NIX29231.1 helix-turn-helix domain-containing protein [Phycisphaerae bacterium]
MSRPVFVRKLTRSEFAQITRLIRSKEDARIVRRAQMIRLSSQGKKAPEISEMWGVTTATVLRTIQNFNAAGLESLADKPRKGRPRKTTDRYIALLKEAVQKSPRDFGYPFSSWTLERLREHLGRQAGTLLNPRYLSQLMAREGIVYRRPKHLMAHLRDPKDYNEKKAILEFLKNARSKGTPDSTLSTLTNVKFTCTRP